MGIWVRSQDRGLGEYTKFLPPIINYEQKTDPEVPFCTIQGEILNVSIMGMDISGKVDKLGTYPTEAEAIAVLDMIQERIDMTRPESVMAQGKVFQMPAAGKKEG